MFCLNFSKSLAFICPPEALRCPPYLESGRSFVAAFSSFGRSAFGDWCLADILSRDLFEPSSEKKIKMSFGLSLLIIAITIPFIWNLGSNE